MEAGGWKEGVAVDREQGRAVRADTRTRAGPQEPRWKDTDTCNIQHY